MSTALTLLCGCKRAADNTMQLRQTVDVIAACGDRRYDLKTNRRALSSHSDDARTFYRPVCSRGTRALNATTLGASSPMSPELATTRQPLLNGESLGGFAGVKQISPRRRDLRQPVIVTRVLGLSRLKRCRHDIATPLWCPTSNHFGLSLDYLLTSSDAQRSHPQSLPIAFTRALVMSSGRQATNWSGRRRTDLQEVRTGFIAQSRN